MLRIPTIKHHAFLGLFQALACAFLILSLWLPGQQLMAAVPEADDNENVDIDGTHHIAPDVPSVLIRNWYTSPDKKPFFSGRNSLLQGWSVVGFWSPQYSLSPSKYSSFSALGVGAGVQKDFSKSHALRLSGAYMNGDIPASSAEVERYMGSLDYLWNFSNTWFGYDPARSLEALLVVGGTFGVVKSEHRESNKVWQAQLGLQLRKTLSPHLSAFFEPYYYVSDPDYDYYENGADFDDGIGAKAGLLVRLTGPLRETPWFDPWANPRFFEDWYIQNLGGLNFAKEKGLTAKHDISNYSFNLNIGRWMAPAWGFQVGVVDRQLLFEGNNNRRQTFGRLEGIMNVSSLWDQVSIKRLGLVLSGGAELGMNREYASTRGRTWTRSDKFLGAVTGAAQLKYFLSPYTALVAEGRYSSAGDGKSVVTPSVGLEFYRSHYYKYSFWRKSAQQRHEEKTKQGEGGLLYLNSRNWFLEAGLGIDRASNVSRYKVLDLAPAAEVAIGLHLDDWHSVRLKDHVIYYSKENARYTQFHNELSLDYMFDLTNFWLELNQYRRYALRPFAGVVLSSSNIATSPYVKEDPNHSIAFDFGFQNSFRLNSNTEIFIEPRYLYMFDEFNHWSLSAGVSYSIERNPQLRYLYKQGVSENPSHFYVQALGGMQIATNRSFTRATEPNGFFDLTLGHTFVRNLAVQGTIFQQTASRNSKSMVHRLYGVRGEFVADALGMLWPQSHEQGWAWALQGGAEVAYNTFVSSIYYGPTAATQLRRRIGRTPFWATVQGRLQFHLAKAGKVKGKAPIWTAAAGIHYELPSSKVWRKGWNGSFGTIDMYRSDIDLPDWMLYLKNWSVELAGNWFDAEKYGFGIALGYDFNDVNSIRIGYNFSPSPQTTSRREEVNYNAFSADYMLDLTNLLLKARTSKDDNSQQETYASHMKLISRLSVRPFVGINLGMHSFDRNKRVYDSAAKEYHYTRMTDLNLGLQTGLNVNYRINQYFGVFLEQRILYLNNDPYLAPDDEHDVHALTSAGLKVSF